MTTSRHHIRNSGQKDGRPRSQTFLKNNSRMLCEPNATVFLPAQERKKKIGIEPAVWFRIVIPGRREAPGPESHAISCYLMGFRVRGSAAPRNDAV
jgi:hypothetical protein